MKCQQCENLLTEYVDGVLASERRDEVASHLVDCADCRKLHLELEALKRLLAGMADPRPREEFWPAAIDRVKPAVTRRKRIYRTALRIQAAGVGITAAVLGFAVLFAPSSRENLERPARVLVATFDPAELISLHAAARATRPLADTGKIRFAISEGNARDYANDDALKVD